MVGEKINRTFKVISVLALLLLCGTTQARADSPQIREFRLLIADCTVPNPDQAVLSYKVSGTIRRISINAYRGASSYRIHHRYYPTPEFLHIDAPGIKDPNPIPTTFWYELVVEGANGEEVKQRIAAKYSFEVDLELTGEVSTLSTNPFHYEVPFRGKNVDEVRVSLDVGPGLGAFSFSTAARIITDDRRREYNQWVEGIIEFTMPRLENRLSRELYPHLDKVFNFRAEGYSPREQCPNVWKEVTKTYRVSRPAPESPREDRPTPRDSTPPPSSTALPDLVPVIESFDGSTVSFRIENRGRAAVSRTFQVSIESPGGMDHEYIPVTERIEPGGSWFSGVRNVALIVDRTERSRADRVVIIVDSGRVVDELNEGNNSDRRPR